MEEFADAKEDKNKKIVHTYPLVRDCDMSEEMKSESVEVVIAACEKYGANYDEAAKAINFTMDKKYGPHWNAVVGEAYGLNITHEDNTRLYMFFGGNLAIFVWKI